MSTSNGSPTAFLLWAILSCIFFTFLLLHLWAYDRFKCLKWDSGRQPGAFKRVMTYSYIGTLPLLVIFGVVMTVFKFRAGYVVLEDGSIIPRPLSAWALPDRHWLLPLYFVFSVGWSLELVTHLEELAFWLFLLHQGPGKREWFESWEFRVWYLGSMVAVLGMPLVTLVTRRDIDRVLAWNFLAGASAGTITTIFFLYVLARFPRFIVYVKEGGAEPDVVIRLSTFYQLNRIRVLFRFLFTLPLLMLGVDALNGPYPILRNPFAVDFLLMMGGIGCFISSAITLFVRVSIPIRPQNAVVLRLYSLRQIFFPRSIITESGYGAKLVAPPHNVSKVPTAIISPSQNYFTAEQEPTSPKRAYYSSAPNTSAEAAAMSMNASHYPSDAPDINTEHVMYAVDSAPAQSRRSGEAGDEMSPGYESDRESFGMAPSPTLPFHHKMVSPRQDALPAAPSRPNSGGRSDDTVWEPPEDFPSPSTAHGQMELMPSSSSAMRRRPHSDALFVYNNQGVVISTVPRAESNASRATSEDAHTQSYVRHRPSNPHRESMSHLHPYLINFTSPIDLLDDLSSPPPPPPDESRPSHIV